MDEETFILCVQPYKILYNLYDPHYSNNQRRENCWREIARAMKETPESCKQLWRKLKDGYRKCKKKRDTKSGQAACGKHRAWKWEKQMSFLDEFTIERKTHSNSNSAADSLTSQEEDSGNQYDTMSDGEADTDDPRPNDAAIGGGDTGHTTEEYDRNGSAANRKKSGGKTKSQAVRGGANIENALMSYLEKKKNQNVEKKSSPLRSFFTSMAETAETLPPHLQILLKADVLKIVSDYEMRALNIATNSRQSSEPEVPAWRPNEDDFSTTRTLPKIINIECFDGGDPSCSTQYLSL